MTMYGLVLSDVKRARKMPWNDILITLFARFSITLNDSYWLMWMFYLKLIKYNTKSLYMNFIMNMIFIRWGYPPPPFFSPGSYGHAVDYWKCFQ